MNLTQLTEKVFVCGQIQPQDASELKKQGFGTIICNRPDGEEMNQPTAAQVQVSVEGEGMKFFFVPFNPSNPNPQMVPDFATAVEKAGEDKILAYCRSGNRSSRLWAAISQN